MKELSGSSTPASLNASAKECIKKQDYDNAVLISFVAGMYGRFDVERGAKEAQPKLFDKTFRETDAFRSSLSREEQTAYREAIRKAFPDQKPGPAYCSAVATAPLPTYPLTDADGKSVPLKPAFDAKASWQGFLAKHSGCEVAK